MKSIFDPTFRYKPSFETDVRKTFERIRREQQQGRRSAASGSSPTVKVLQLDQRKQRTG